MSVVIKVENLSKLYRLGEVGTGTLSHDLNRMWAKVRGKEDPFAKVVQVNDRSQKAESDYVWSLKDINFEIEQGDVVGIIGKNGAGKSTLLKIISQITSPTTGQIKVKGRIASLLEVGTGMHPEMTARENIFLNGAILGMTKKEIQNKFDEIIDFSGCALYVDTPIKRFSSGMKVRLGFAVAAFLEPEILIVDEVLAVGDAEFQKKAIGKMQDVSKNDGRTVLFVSHNMAAVIQLCKKSIVLSNGKLLNYSNVENAIEFYLGSNKNSTCIDFSNYEARYGSGIIRISEIKILLNGKYSSEIPLGSKLVFEIKLKNINHQNIDKLRFIIGVYNSLNEGFLRFDTNSTNTIINLSIDDASIICLVNEPLNIKPDNYYVNVAIMREGEMIDYVEGGASFSVLNFDYYGSGRDLDNIELAKVYYKHFWKTNYNINEQDKN